MKHRGPDAAGFADVGMVTIGTNRLAIVDPKAVDLCPAKLGKWVMAYNGEVYNHMELRRQMKRRTFRTQTDTETVLHAWSLWGEDALPKLNGMFAFAITDGRKVHLVRDRAGEKPLYYYWDGTTFAVASEAQALAHEFKPKVRADTFFETFEYCRGTTLWEHIEEVLPGEMVTFSCQTKKLTRKRWWEPQPYPVDLLHPDEQLEELIGDAVRIRLMADVSVALYESGGMDSALIRSFLPEDAGAYPGITFDETTDHGGAFRAALPKVVEHLGTPVGSFSPYGLWWLSEEAHRRGIKVVLSGEGADELFGGYGRMILYNHILRAREMLPEYVPLWERLLGSPELLYARLTARNGNEGAITPLLASYGNIGPLARACRFEFDYLLPMLLQMGDRMAMAHSVENRCPFLDHRIIEFSLSLPDHLRIQEERGKVLLRRILARRMPEHPSLTSPKQGLFFDVYGPLGIVSPKYDRRAWLNHQTLLWKDR